MVAQVFGRVKRGNGYKLSCKRRAICLITLENAVNVRHAKRPGYRVSQAVDLIGMGSCGKCSAELRAEFVAVN